MGHYRLAQDEYRLVGEGLNIWKPDDAPANHPSLP
jgi:hypothetical protein